MLLLILLVAFVTTVSATSECSIIEAPFPRYTIIGNNQTNTELLSSNVVHIDWGCVMNDKLEVTINGNVTRFYSYTNQNTTTSIISIPTNYITKETPIDVTIEETGKETACAEVFKTCRITIEKTNVLINRSNQVNYKYSIYYFLNAVNLQRVFMFANTESLPVAIGLIVLSLCWLVVEYLLLSFFVYKKKGIEFVELVNLQ